MIQNRLRSHIAVKTGDYKVKRINKEIKIR